ncbi:MAG: phosphoadenylyl-sulfate reductase [Anaerolineae bacterium]|nr:phosphoadenylyl-sulfate reductase [Anaerolineae bacterium]
MEQNERERLNEQFETAEPQTIIDWAAEHYLPRLAVTSSFQTQSVALLHMISRAALEIPVIFLDTGYHFPETLAYRDQLVAQFGLTLRVVRPAVSRTDFVQRYGDALYRRDPDLCCYINKVEPMQRALGDLDAWISGIRRDQTPDRAHAQPLEALPDGRFKINPLVTWTRRDLWTYIDHHDLPAHPLFSQGYLSVGCAPCTNPVHDGGDERAGRWSGTAKRECGLHTDALLNAPRDDTHRA